MNHLKKLGIACLLAVAAMAVGGAGSAAAAQSTFCKVNETPCKSGNHYPSGTEFVLKSTGPIKWVSSFEGEPTLQVTCESAEFKGKTSTTGGSAQTVEVAFTTQFLSNCGQCGITTLQTAKMKFNWVSGTMDASVTTTGLEYRFNCKTILGEVSCTYGGEIKEKTTLTGGNPAVLKFEAAPVTASGGLPCGNQAELTGEFDVTTPKPLYVSNT
ncbi:MAG TPA: hypothetical protein VFT79_05105 [Solirubrobacterales bacterium]|nr:hypothetical protein [Solirubrobacterales bacterium]